MSKLRDQVRLELNITEKGRKLLDREKQPTIEEKLNSEAKAAFSNLVLTACNTLQTALADDTKIVREAKVNLSLEIVRVVGINFPLK
jgi:hypothetical protein